MNEYFDKIYCINLDRRPDRWQESQIEFKKHNLTVERFAAIDGNPDNILTEIVPGHVGCVLSHYNIIKQSEGLNQILIFEDDVTFIDDLQTKFKEYIKQVPEDWDLLYFGGNHNGLPLEMISDNVAKVKKTYTNHAYAIRKTVFKDVVEMFPKMSHEVDVMYSILQTKYNCYVFRPHLAWQRESYSDILNENVYYEFLKK